MKIGFLAAIAAVVMAFSGTAQAGAFSYTLQGTVTGVYTQYYTEDYTNGFTSGTSSNTDYSGLFGGGILTGSAMSMSFAYNTSGMPIDSTYTDQPTGGGANVGWNNSSFANGALSYSMTIGGDTQGSVSDPNALSALSLSYNGAAPPAQNSAYLGLNVYRPGQSGNSFLIYSNTSFEDEIDNQAYMDEFVANLCNGLIANTGNCRFFIDSTQYTANGYTGYSEAISFSLPDAPPSTPEPSTWLMLATGAIITAWLKYRRAAGRA
jgi:hypothetical protein